MRNVIKTTILIILATSLTSCCNGKRNGANTEACTDTEQVKPSRFPKEISDPGEALNLISKYLVECKDVEEARKEYGSMMLMEAVESVWDDGSTLFVSTNDTSLFHTAVFLNIFQEEDEDGNPYWGELIDNRDKTPKWIRKYFEP